MHVYIYIYIYIYMICLKTFFWSSEGREPCSGRTQRRAISSLNSRSCSRASQSY